MSRNSSAASDAIQRLNRLHRDGLVGQPELQGRIEAFETAFRMQMSASEVFDLGRDGIHPRVVW